MLKRKDWLSITALFVALVWASMAWAQAVAVTPTVTPDAPGAVSVFLKTFIPVLGAILPLAAKFLLPGLLAKLPVGVVAVLNMVVAAFVTALAATGANALPDSIIDVQMDPTTIGTAGAAAGLFGHVASESLPTKTVAAQAEATKK